FASPFLSFDTGVSPGFVGTVDLNADGKLDLVVANGSSNTVSVLLGDGGAGFSAKTDFAVGLAPMDVAIGDLDADGRLDLIVPNQNSRTVSVLLGNGDGT